MRTMSGLMPLDYSKANAHEQFARLHRQAFWRGLWSRLTRQPHSLLALDAVRKHYYIHAPIPAGICTVPIADVVGTEGRAADFDANFRPIRDHNRGRWMGIYLVHTRGEALPPVDLIELDGKYFVRDGHHRISVARVIGQVEIEANVTVWQAAPRRTTVQPVNASRPRPAGSRWLEQVRAALQRGLQGARSTAA